MGQKKIRFIKELRKFKKIISNDDGIERIILFGSRAKGKYSKYSDFDLIVVSKRFKNINKLDRSYNLYLKWNINRPVDFLCYTPEEFNRLKKQITIVREAFRGGIEI